MVIRIKIIFFMALYNFQKEHFKGHLVLPLCLVIIASNVAIITVIITIIINRLFI